MTDITQQPNAGTAIPGEAAPNVDVEVRAKRMGWTPKDDFRGNPEKWVDADAFVARADEELPLNRAEIRRLHQTITNMGQQLAQMQGSQGRIASAAYQRAVEDLERQKLAAVAVGDTQSYQALNQQVARVQQEYAPLIQPQQRNAVPTEVMDWVTENPWFDHDPELRHMATAMEVIESQKTPNAAPRVVLERVKAEIQRRYPEKFNNGARSAPASVEGVPDARGGKRGGKLTFADLDAETKAACDKFVKQGVFKTRDDYVKSYAEEYGNV